MNTNNPSILSATNLFRSALAVLLTFSALACDRLSQKGPLDINASLTDEGVTLTIAARKGYGLQKEAPHALSLYHPDQKTGEKIYSVEGVVFSGTTAEEDQKYFSQTNPFIIPVHPEKIPGEITGELYFCSFESSFCSVHSFSLPLKQEN